MKKSKRIVLLVAPVLSTLLFSACGGGEDTTRDVYGSREDCLKDWGDQELCSEMDDNDSNEYKRSTGSSYAGRGYWGPIYYPSDRSVIYKGRTISPPGKTTTMRPFVVTSRSSSSSRSSVSSPRGGGSTSYGGFGGGGGSSYGG